MKEETQLDRIEKILAHSQKEGRIMSAIQIAALILVFFFEIETIRDIKKLFK